MFELTDIIWKNEPHTCECGCGLVTKEDKRFIHNHHTRCFSKETRYAIGTGSRGKHHSVEHNRKIKEANAFTHLGSIPWNKGLTKDTDERVARNAENNKIPHTGKPGYWQDKKRYPETIKLLSEIAINNWKNNAEYISKYRNGLNTKPNKPETMILNLLEDLYPNEWKFTGDFSFMIAGKSPDFTNINGQKKLIELFGDYWHEGQNPQDRINVFKPFGYDTLVIWQSELKDINKVKDRIIEFSEMNHVE